MARIIRAFVAFRDDSAHSLSDMAMAAPTAAWGDAPALDAGSVRLSSPRLRWKVLSAAALGPSRALRGGAARRGVSAARELKNRPSITFKECGSHWPCWR